MTDFSNELRDALAAHAQWKTRLKNAVESGTSEFDPAVVARDDRCAFGKWLHGAAATDAGRSPHYASCTQAHAQFHVDAAEVLELAVAGRRAEADAKLSLSGAFCRSSAAVSSEILAWLKDQTGTAVTDRAAGATGRFARTRFSITSKLVSMVAACLSMLVLVGVLGILGLQSASSSANRMYVQSVQPLGEVGVAGITYNKNRTLLRDLVLVSDPTALAQVRTELAANSALIDRKLAAASQHADGRAAVILRRLRANLAKYAPVRQRYIALTRVGNDAQAQQLSVTYSTLIKSIGADFDSLIVTEQQLAATDQHAVASTASSNSTITIAALVAGFLAGGVLAFFISRGIVRGIRRMVGAAERIGQGDLTVDVGDVRSRDEIGDMARAFQTMVNALHATVGMVATTAGELGVSAQEMTTTAEEAGKAANEIATAVGDVAEGAEKQVQAVEQARQMTDDMAVAASSSAAGAEQTTAAAREAREVAEAGAGAATEATRAMEAVRDSSTAVTEAIRALGAKSEQIGGIVATITGIAEQTNLLALNAAIEAARAGEQGRGFAVVAEEVRKLAEESQTAAASIAGLIGEIQGETQRAVGVVEDGAKRTEDGVAVVDQTREAFSRISGSVQDVTTRVEEITRAIAEMAASSQHIQSEITAVAAVAESSSASAEQVSASTQETSASTDQIHQSARKLSIVSRFTL
jgi:methyl-accepting chemotaxis protein